MDSSVLFKQREVAVLIFIFPKIYLINVKLINEKMSNEDF